MDEIPKPVVVALLKAGHAGDHRRFAHDPQLIEAMRDVARPEMVRRDDNSRRQIQNVRGDSSGILSAIRRSAFIIADVSEPRPNVYYELGYAQALGKDAIITALEGTQLPFDIYDVPTLYWDSQDTLETKLKVEVSRIAQKFGRDRLEMGT